MTPEAKAKELVNKYLKLTINTLYIDGDGDSCLSAGSMTQYSAKQCALICCEEMIEESDEYEFGHPNLVEERKAFWQSVKTEINKL